MADRSAIEWTDALGYQPRPATRPVVYTERATWTVLMPGRLQVRVSLWWGQGHLESRHRL